MNTILYIFAIIQWLLIIYMWFSVLYLFLFAIAGLFNHKLLKTKINKQKRFIIFIPAYKEDEIIINVIIDALKQNYPKNLFRICVIADKLKEETICKLKEYDIDILIVDFEQSTKSKALNYALKNYTVNQFDIGIILDADNLMEPDFLTKTGEIISSEVKVIQGHRTAKNKNTAFAILDAISEEINNHIFRKGHRSLGLSAALIGSAIGIDFELFKQIMPTINAVGGFDKELELKLLKNNFKIEYIPDAYVFDEKIQNSKSFSSQRKRWLSAQFYYFRKFLPDATYHLFVKGNINYFNKALQMFFLPRVLLLGISFVFTCLTFFINPLFISFCWILIFILIVLTISISIPKNFYNIKFFYALLSIPKAFLILLLVLFKIKNANKKYIHTQHLINVKDE